jgi:DNA polymerase III epsilon subunit family exonuclease
MHDNVKLTDAVFCALDFETTGINPVLDRIIEIGMVRFTMDRVLDTFSTFINPRRDIPEGAVRIHGITGDMVKDAPPISSMLERVESFIGGSPLVIQNPRFDLAFLEAAFKESSRSLPRLEAYDTVRLSRKTFPDLPNYRLQTLCENLNIRICYHRALSDAEGCMEVFRKVVQNHDREGRWAMDDLINLHGRALQPRLTRKQKRMLNLDNTILLGDVVQIRYMDNNGNITTRRILPKELVQNGSKSYIYAFCYMRNDNRYFNTRRILKVY